MNHGLAASVLLAVLASLPFAYAQVSAPSDRPAATGTSTSRDSVPTALRSGREPVASADPRICLEFPTNLQVIACAEKYRPHRRRAADA